MHIRTEHVSCNRIFHAYHSCNYLLKQKQPLPPASNASTHSFSHNICISLFQFHSSVNFRLQSFSFAPPFSVCYVDDGWASVLIVGAKARNTFQFLLSIIGFPYAHMLRKPIGMYSVRAISCTYHFANIIPSKIRLLELIFPTYIANVKFIRYGTVKSMRLCLCMFVAALFVSMRKIFNIPLLYLSVFNMVDMWMYMYVCILYIHYPSNKLHNIMESK